MEIKQAEEKILGYTGLSKVEQHCFPIMTKEEIIEKYIEMKAKFIKVDKEARLYYSALVSVFKDYELLKSKYPDIDQAEYNRNWSWVNKIVFALRKTDRPLLSSEIIELLVPHEPILKFNSQRPQAFSANLHKALKHQRVIAYKRGGSRGYFYVLPHWMDGQDILQKKYEDKIFIR